MSHNPYYSLVGLSYAEGVKSVYSFVYHKHCTSVDFIINCKVYRLIALGLVHKRQTCINTLCPELPVEEIVEDLPEIPEVPSVEGIFDEV